MKVFKNSILLFLSLIISIGGSCQNSHEIKSIDVGLAKEIGKVKTENEITTGASQINGLSETFFEKKVALVANHTSTIGNKHLLDSLLNLGVEVVKIFSPEHGFRGYADAGELVSNQRDKATGLPIVSLYGANKKPKLKDLIDVDLVVFDIQDVGVRFYTYISTLYYVMEACAEAEIPLVVLDRPNPNGFYVDGPVLDMAFTSFVGIVPIPVVYGMTIGEFALMVNGENWLRENLVCNLKVVPLKNYNHSDMIQIESKPSPNLPNMASIYLYTSLCFFEGTVISVGRGTDFPFQIFGNPQLNSQFSFIPTTRQGAKYPPFENQKCFGYDLREDGKNFTSNPFGLTLKWLIQTYQELNLGASYFLPNNFIDLLAGTDQLRLQIIEGKSEEEIRASWQPQLDEFKEIRKKYLLYP